jgi:hypothetical protein
MAMVKDPPTPKINLPINNKLKLFAVAVIKQPKNVKIVVSKPIFFTPYLSDKMPEGIEKTIPGMTTMDINNPA